MCFLVFLHMLSFFSAHTLPTAHTPLFMLVGTMTGGGSRVIRGRMSSKSVVEVTPGELKQQEMDLEREEKELEVRTIIVIFIMHKSNILYCTQTIVESV